MADSEQPIDSTYGVYDGVLEPGVLPCAGCGDVIEPAAIIPDACMLKLLKTVRASRRLELRFVKSKSVKAPILLSLTDQYVTFGRSPVTALATS
jgi:hypothetical protein